MSITYLPKYGYYCAEIGPLTIYSHDRETAIKRVLDWFKRIYGDHA